MKEELMSRRPRFALSLALVSGLIASALTLGTAYAAPAERDAGLVLTSVSNPHPDLVSGGDVLLRVTAPRGVDLDRVRATRNGVDVTSSFASQPNGTLLGLVTGLRLGENLIRARVGGDEETGSVQLRVINHKITGPVFSGPQQVPFFCETAAFGLVSTAATPLCSAATQVTYQYRTTSGAFLSLADPSSRPADLAQATVNGQSVPYIVRLERGTIDRAVYEIAALFDGQQPNPLRMDSSWNGRLVYTFGGGCNAGYHQGNATGGVINDLFLGQGYAVASSTLNVLNTNCSPIISAEAAMMVKEHFIETYGPTQHTIGWGGSGGAIQQYDIADSYPGIIDGLIPAASFPNANGTTLSVVTDCRLLDNVFNAGPFHTGPVGNGFTAAQMTAVAGFGFYSSCTSWDGSFANRIQATASCDPATQIGVKCAAIEQLVNQLGRNPETGFVRSYLDNVGVQYGLAALESGTITPEQFVKLNESIGGFDVAGNAVPQRSHADRRALDAFYADDLNMSGGLGLATTPVIDQRVDVDAFPGLNIHTSEWSYVVRQRMIEHGTAANQVIIENSLASWPAAMAYELTAMDQWLTNIDLDTSHRSLQSKVAQDKPSGLGDGCFVSDATRIVEALTYKGSGTCPTLYPIFSNPRLAAAQPLDLYTLKCSLRRIDFSAYPVAFTPNQQMRLRAAFPQGVCDYSRRGVAERAPRGTWLNYSSNEDISSD
jgi:hypothetical protein